MAVLSWWSNLCHELRNCVGIRDGDRSKKRSKNKSPILPNSGLIYRHFSVLEPSFYT